jgi:hypothetical protein
MIGVFENSNRLTFKARVLLLFTLAVGLPAVATCVLLGWQLGTRSRDHFASEVEGKLSMFVLLAREQQRELADSRVEERRGNADLKPASRFLSPLIEPDVQVSRIRLSDWLRVRLTAATPTLGAGDGGRRVRRTLACRRTPACHAPAACVAV